MSGLIPGDFVEVSRHKKVEKEVEKLRKEVEKLTKMNRKYRAKGAETEEKYNSARMEVEKLTLIVKKRKSFKGRNKIKKNEMDGYEHINNENLNKWYKYHVAPHLKFLPKVVYEWDPEDPNGFSERVLAVVDIPEEADIMEYYYESLLPIYNKNRCQWSSNANTNCRVVFIREWRSSVMYCITKKLTSLSLIYAQVIAQPTRMGHTSLPTTSRCCWIHRPRSRTPRYYGLSTI